LTPEARWVLASQLWVIRAESLRTDWTYAQRTRSLAFTGGAIAALSAVNAISEQEAHEWRTRLSTAVRIDQAGMAQGQSTRAIGFRSEVDAHRARTQMSEPNGPPLRSYLGGAIKAFGGTNRVDSVSLWEDQAQINWTVQSRPDVQAAYPELFLSIRQELEGLDQSIVDISIDEAVSEFQRVVIPQIYANDDVQTVYRTVPGRQEQSGAAITGCTRVFPAPPLTANVLTLTWLGGEITVPLST
jgi:hypothetical protein